MKTFLITFGTIITLIVLIWGLPALLKTSEQAGYDPAGTSGAVIGFLLFLAVGLIPLIIGLSIKKKK
ncbi:MAG: hypothetical protein KIT66_09925 [Chitinophagaceae bacterium]|nr:hypothetical protein [Chitinophagaceae bacterium]